MILALAILLVIALPMTAYAGSIQITPPGNASVEDQEFRAYQIFTVVTYEDEAATRYIYTLNPAYEGFEAFYSTELGGKGLKAYIMGMFDASDNFIPGRQADLETLARALWNWSVDNNDTNVISAVGTAAGVTFAGLDAGYYIIAGDALFFETNPVKTFAALCTVLDDDENLEVQFKADAPKIEKEVWNHNSGSGDWEKWTDVSIGDEVQFKLTSTIPDTTNYEQYFYKVTDTMSGGLTFIKIDSVIAYIGDTGTELFEDEYYVFTGPGPAGTKGGTFTVTINSDVLISLSEDGYDRIEIIYTAVLNENAVIEDEGNPNNVKLEYSNNPNWEGDGKPDTGETPEDDAWVYTYKLNVFKYTALDTPLLGVEFQLFNSAGEVAVFTLTDGGIYIFQGFIEALPDPGEDAEPAETEAYEAYLARTLLITDEDGMIYIVGIDEGEYILHEFWPPEGYNAVDDVTVNVINKHLIDPGIAEDMDELITYLNENRGGADTGASLANGSEQVDVYNGKGPQFPDTGGIGRTIFYLAGAGLTVGLITFFVARRRRNILDGKSEASV